MPFCAAILALFAALASTARAQTLPSNDWQISVLTFGPGPAIYERYGHVAIRLKNDAGGFDLCYDWGNFDFNDPGFIGRFIKGDLRYWMEGKPADRMIDFYVHELDRTVVEQTLNLTPAQTHRLLVLLRDQDDDDHRYYQYDYFKDNCSTRVRDAVDLATSGALRSQLTTITPWTLRSENRRVVPVGWDNVALQPLMDMAMGPRIDAPLDVWGDCFLPGRLADALDKTQVIDADGKWVPLVRQRRVLNTTTTPANFEPTKPLNSAWITLPIGVIGGLALVFFAGRVPILFKLGATLWELFALLGGLFMAGVILFTKHWVVAWDENLIQFTPLALPVLWCIWRKRRSTKHTNDTNQNESVSIRVHSCASWTFPLPSALALGLSIVGTLVTISHLTPQANAPGVLLALPLHAAVYVGLRRLTCE